MKKLLILGLLLVLVGSLFASVTPEVKRTNEVVVCELNIQAMQVQSIDLNVVMTFDNIIEADFATVFDSEIKESTVQNAYQIKERFVLVEPCFKNMVLFNNGTVNYKHIDAIQILRDKKRIKIYPLKLSYSTGKQSNFNYLC